MFFVEDGKVRLTQSEQKLLRTSAAQNGVTVKTVKTREELNSAICNALDEKTAEDLLAFLDAPSTPIKNSEP